ncbi:Dnl2 protein-like protein [Tribonema minus]|uniref:Dynein light chain n=1 Tax=Tribonema minus TaxID=303371 RepID=A0A836CI24_9STRA|nr:Dnl2 protein-like protein [Tribonema minus]
MSARPVIKTSTMPADMQEAAIQVAQDAIKDNNLEKEIAHAIKTNFERIYPSVWHCFVGRNFGSFVTHEQSKFIYFYIGQMGVCLFSTA